MIGGDQLLEPKPVLKDPVALANANPTHDSDGKLLDNTIDVFDPKKIVERWEGEAKGVPAPEGFNPDKFNPQAIEKRWKGKNPAIDDVNMEDVGGKLARNEWRKNDPGAKYDEWIKGAGPHSKLGKTYRELQAKVREANKTKFVPRTLKDIAGISLPKTPQTNK